MSNVDLSRLPAPNIVEELDFETIFEQRKLKFISLYPADKQAEIAKTLELESDPIVITLQENAYREIVWRQRVNEAARAVMLAYSQGDDLENLAANFDVDRLTITPEDATTIPPTPAVMEADTSLKDRTQQAFEGLSVAGPREAYKFHARSADGRVSDASAISPAGAEVIVTVLSNIGNGAAPVDLVANVQAALNDEDIRPLGDRLTVQGAAIVNYAIAATIYLEQGPESEPILAAAQASADAYRNEQRRLGRDVNRSAIIAALHVEGVTKVVLDSPAADIAIDDTQAAYCTGVAITNGGASG